MRVDLHLCRQIAELRDPIDGPSSSCESRPAIEHIPIRPQGPSPRFRIPGWR
jgi:hypothetical protein